MSDVRKLDLVKAEPVEDRIRAEVVQLLERYLEEAKRGEVRELFVLALHDNDEWSR
jgi:N-acetylglutamate synthase-like GNAT family acetyltransferase